MDATNEWEVLQVHRTITPGTPHLQRSLAVGEDHSAGRRALGFRPADDKALAHANSTMTCYTCHTSWTPNCFGCHLSTSVNRKTPMLHNEGPETRNGRRTTPRSCATTGSCSGATARSRATDRAGAVGVRRARELAERDARPALLQAADDLGRASTASVQHVRAAHRSRKETKQCADCHVSDARDNNAWMAQPADARHELQSTSLGATPGSRPAPGDSRRWPSPSATSRRPCSAAISRSSPTRATTPASSERTGADRLAATRGQ